MKYTAADRKWARAVKERDRFTCRRCGKQYPEKSQGLHAAHVTSRRHKATRTDLRAGVALCYGCHRHVDLNPEYKQTFMRGLVGDAVYDELVALNRGKFLRAVGNVEEATDE